MGSFIWWQGQGCSGPQGWPLPWKSWLFRWAVPGLPQICSNHPRGRMLCPSRVCQAQWGGDGRAELPCAEMIWFSPSEVLTGDQKALQEQQQPHAQNQLQFKSSFWECLQQFLPCFPSLPWLLWSGGVWLALCCCGQGKNHLCLCLWSLSWGRKLHRKTGINHSQTVLFFFFLLFEWFPIFFSCWNL